LSFESVLLILADSSRPDVMRDLAAAGEMPTFKRHFIDVGGFRPATTVFPSLSGPAHLPVLTGLHPGRANLPGIRWAQRPRRDGANFIGRTRSYMAPFRVRRLERDIPRHVPSLFQHIDGLAEVNTWFVRGCKLRSKRNRLARVPAFFRSLATRDWRRVDDPVEGSVHAALDGGARSISAVFPAIDELGHRFGPLAEESFDAYRQFDRRLGRIIDHLVRRGTWETTLVAVWSDHGQSATHTHIDLERVVASIYERTLAYPLLYRHILDADAAVMVSGNAMANLYVAGANGWSQFPDFDDDRSRAAALVERLLAEEGIDHVIYRRGPEIILRAARGTMAIAATGEITIEGEHPLGDAPERRYPDHAAQLRQFFLSARAGDLVVCAAAGYDLRARFEYQPHRGSHGALLDEHMNVYAAVNAPWAEGSPLHTVDLFPTILAALGRPVPPNSDGVAGRILANEK